MNSVSISFQISLRNAFEYLTQILRGNLPNVYSKISTRVSVEISSRIPSKVTYMILIMTKKSQKIFFQKLQELSRIPSEICSCILPGIPTKNTVQTFFGNCSKNYFRNSTKYFLSTSFSQSFRYPSKKSFRNSSRNTVRHYFMYSSKD